MRIPTTLPLDRFALLAGLRTELDAVIATWAAEQAAKVRCRTGVLYRRSYRQFGRNRSSEASKTQIATTNSWSPKADKLHRLALCP